MRYICQKVNCGTKRAAYFFSMLPTIFVMSTSLVFACGGVLDVGCNLQNGGMSPDNWKKQSDKALQDAARPITESTVTAAGNALAQWMIASRNTAMNGAMPIPRDVRQALTGYASEDSMNRARYNIGDSGFANLANNLEKGGLATAVTLIDVIVFRGPSEASDPALWAHELTHVDQYREWGVVSFAVQYVRNWHGVEDPAYAKQNGYQAWAQQHTFNVAAPASESRSAGPVAVGVWNWFNPIGSAVQIIANGTVVQSLNGDQTNGGTWLQKSDGSIQISWNNGYVDEFKLSSDGNSMSGSNQNGALPMVSRK
jgi:hypothetical protein